MLFAKVTRTLAVLSCSAMLAFPAVAQQYPTKPIRILLGFGAGGTTDAVARLYGQKLSALLKTPVIIENKPGANQLLAIRLLQMAPPDGYTLYAATASALIQNPALRNNLTYSPLKDFSYIGIAVTNPAVIFVSPNLPVKTVAELVAYSTSHPTELNFGSAGIGTAGHLAAEALVDLTGMKMTHVPYKSDAEVIRAVMAGESHVGIMTTLNTMPFVKAGKIRALAVTTAQRLPYLPNVSSLSEVGIKGLSNLEPHTFISIVGPAGMPPAVISKLNEAINKVSAMPDVALRVREGFFAEPTSGTPAGFKAFVEGEIVKWRVLGKTVKLPD